MWVSFYSDLSEESEDKLMIAMADFHYTPNPDGPTQQLLTTLKNLDCTSSPPSTADIRRYNPRLPVPRTE